MDLTELTDRLVTSSGEERERLIAEAARSGEAAETLLGRARAALATEPPAAVEAARASAEVSERRSEPLRAAAAYRVQAQGLRILGRHSEALEVFDRAAAAAVEGGDPLLAAQVQIGRIDSLGWLGRDDEAGALARRLETELRQLGAEGEAAKVLVNLGNLHFRRDEYSAALTCYDRARQAISATGDAVAEARIEANCANILTHLYRVDEAITRYAHARSTFQDQGMEREAAMGDGNVGFLEFLSGRHASALAAFHRARSTFGSGGQEIEAAKADLDMAEVYRTLNLIPESLEHYEESITVFDRTGLVYERAKAELGRGAALASANRPEEALTALEVAETFFDTQKNRVQHAHVQLVRSAVLQSLGQSQPARRQAHAAYRTFARRGLKGWAAEAQLVVAEIDLAAGVDVARRLLGIRRRASEYGRGWLEARAERALGRAYLAKGRAAAAIRHFRAGIAALESARTLVTPEEMHVAFLRDKLGIYEDLISLLLERARPADIREALRQIERAKSRLLLERMEAAERGGIGENATPLSRAAREKLAGVRAELNRLYHQMHTSDDRAPRRFAGDEAAAGTSVRALEAAYRTALREANLSASYVPLDASVPWVSSDSKNYQQTDQPALTDYGTLEEIQTALGEDETLLEYYVGDGAVSAFVVTGSAIRLFHRIASQAEVEQAARRLRYHLQKAGMAPDYAQRHFSQLSTGIETVLGRLNELLLAPLTGALSTEKLLIVPHGVLHGLPFHAFCTEETCAIDQWEIAYSPSATLWLAGARRRSTTAPAPPDPHKMLIMGVSVPGIEQVAREVDEIAALAPSAKVFCGEQATMERFRSLAPGSEVIHLATHALYRADNPLFSGLKLTDEWLLARDLYEMPLGCRLATLSACQTGMTHVAPGDELFGLVRGFLAAGVRSIAASLWPADDAATASLMGRFYQSLMRGESAAAALRSAQQITRRDNTHPYLWAAFALIGER